MAEELFLVDRAALCAGASRKEAQQQRRGKRGSEDLEKGGLWVL